MQIIVYQYFKHTKRTTLKNTRIKIIFYFVFYFDLTKNIHRFA